jgi:hypothetical protein
MEGGDGGLHRKRTGSGAQCFIDQRQRLRDLFAIPEAPILFLQQNQISGLIDASLAPRVMQQHESEESRGFRWRLR